MANAYETALQQYDEAAKILGLPNSIYKRLRVPEWATETNFVIKMDDGSFESVSAHIVLHSKLYGYFKGGVRFDPNVGPDEVKALAIWMTWKNAIANIPFGGAKVGVTCNPRTLSMDEFERLVRNLTRRILPFMSPQSYIPGPDAGANERTMSWMFDEYSRQAGIGDHYNAVTGKPVINKGTQGRTEATGRGVRIVTQKIISDMHLDILRPPAVIIQGFGNVGSVAARELYECGMKVIAISDRGGAIHNKNGLHIPSLLKYVDEQHKKFETAKREISKAKILGRDSSHITLKEPSVCGFPKAVQIDKDDIWSIECDILIPAALENAINDGNACEIKTKLIVEGANGPTTPEGEKKLVRNNPNIVIVPDILANIGGVVVSYFEYTQNTQWYFWTLEKVRQELESKLKEATDGVLAKYKELNSKHSLRMAAYLVGVERVAYAGMARGK